MNIRDWANAKRGRRTRLAESVGCTAEYISMITSGVRRPSPPVALRISEAVRGLTGDEVTVMELLFPGREELKEAV